MNYTVSDTKIATCDSLKKDNIFPNKEPQDLMGCFFKVVDGQFTLFQAETIVDGEATVLKVPQNMLTVYHEILIRKNLTITNSFQKLMTRLGEAGISDRLYHEGLGILTEAKVLIDGQFTLFQAETIVDGEATVLKVPQNMLTVYHEILIRKNVTITNSFQKLMTRLGEAGISDRLYHEGLGILTEAKVLNDAQFTLFQAETIVDGEATVLKVPQNMVTAYHEILIRKNLTITNSFQKLMTRLGEAGISDRLYHEGLGILTEAKVLIDGQFTLFQAETIVDGEATVLKVPQNMLTVYHEILIRKNLTITNSFQKLMTRLGEAGISDRLYHEALGILTEAKVLIDGQFTLFQAETIVDGEATVLKVPQNMLTVYHEILIRKNVTITNSFQKLMTRLGEAGISDRLYHEGLGILTEAKVLSLSLKNTLMDIGTSIFSCSQAYVALSRVTNLHGVHLINVEFKSIKAQASAITEYNRLRHDAQFTLFQAETIVDGEATVLKVPQNMVTAYHEILIRKNLTITNSFQKLMTRLGEAGISDRLYHEGLGILTEAKVLIDGQFTLFQAETIVDGEATVLKVPQNMLTVYHEILIRKNLTITNSFQKLMTRLGEAGITDRLYHEALGILTEAKVLIHSRINTITPAVPIDIVTETVQGKFTIKRTPILLMIPDKEPLFRRQHQTNTQQTTTTIPKQLYLKYHASEYIQDYDQPFIAPVKPQYEVPSINHGQQLFHGQMIPLMKKVVDIRAFKPPRHRVPFTPPDLIEVPERHWHYSHVNFHRPNHPLIRLHDD
ncbi:unnamed protein product [Chilo suppressalis]|uniref:Vitellogenin domain-containing protein n=1 Tax=Chilo suppressalis TaxID=168631 RepID=A0ABN8AWX8_CHISP|nr:unnamed protein product [Chilo suppressalis]